jgi:hypothetical protein
MIKITIDKKPRQFPTKWEEVTFGQYLQIMDSKSITDLIVILLGLDPEEAKKKTIIGLDDLFIAAQFTQDIAKFEEYYPQCGPYKLPSNNKGKFDIRFESLGQFEDMRQVMSKIDSANPASLVTAYGKSVAIYLQKIRDKEYDAGKVAELEEEIKSFPAVEVIGLGQFFFLKLITLSSGTKASSPTTAPSQKKSKQVSKGSRKPLGRTRR